jgi:predicted nucleic acid-binding protein
VNVVDSSAWLEYLADTPRAKHFAAAIEDTERLLAPALVLHEVCKKIRRERGEDAMLQVAAEMQSGALVPVDAQLALEAARLDMPLADSLIYSTARRAGAAVWTQDQDIEGREGVRHIPQ